MSPRTFSALPCHAKYAVNSSTDTVRHGEPGGWWAQKYPAICSALRSDCPITGTRPPPDEPKQPTAANASAATTANGAKRRDRTKRVIGLRKARLEGKVARVPRVVRGATEASRDAGIRCEVVTTAPRIGLVLGAGGVIGHAYHAGVLDGLCDATGWDPRDAEVIVGTSAGSVVGALLRAGFSARDLAARSTGDPVSPKGAELVRRAGMGDGAARFPTGPTRRRGLPRMASPSLLMRAALRPFWMNRPGVMLAGALPAGAVPTELVAAAFRPLFGSDWPERNLWATAVRLRDGNRVVFGRPGVPPVPVAHAVAASCAIPSFFEPVTIGGVPFVDGGVCAPVDERDAADRHRLEEARDGARRRHRVGNGRRRRARSTEHDTVPVAEAHRGQPQIPLGPVGPEQRAERGRDELGRHRPGRERAGQHHAGPVHPERSQRRPHEEGRRRHAWEPPATGRSGREARRSVAHPGPAHELGPLG